MLNHLDTMAKGILTLYYKFRLAYKVLPIGNLGYISIKFYPLGIWDIFFSLRITFYFKWVTITWHADYELASVLGILCKLLGSLLIFAWLCAVYFY